MKQILLSCHTGHTLSLNFSHKAVKKCFAHFVCGRISRLFPYILVHTSWEFWRNLMSVLFLAAKILIWSHLIILTVDLVLSHNFNWGQQTEFGGFRASASSHVKLLQLMFPYFYAAHPKLHMRLLRRVQNINSKSFIGH